MQHLPSIPGFTVLSKLGAGTFGSVFHARWEETGLPVAIKVLHLDEPDAKTRFEREAGLLHQQLDNPHVVDVLGWDLEYKPPYFVMEFCAGGSLESWVKTRHSFQDVTGALLNAAKGLLAIHAAGGFHRDIKPANLLLGTTAQGGPIVKLGDFGLARVPSVETNSFTQRGFGTPAYMAPEVVRGGQATASSDIYGLGLTGVELLIGRREPDELAGATAPARLKKLLASMVASRAAGRPGCAMVIGELESVLEDAKVKAIHRAPAPKIAPRPTVAAAAQPFLAGLLLGAAVLGGIAALAALTDDGEA